MNWLPGAEQESDYIRTSDRRRTALVRSHEIAWRYIGWRGVPLNGAHGKDRVPAALPFDASSAEGFNESIDAAERFSESAERINELRQISFTVGIEHRPSDALRAGIALCVMPFAAKSVQGRQQTSSGLEICCIQSLCKLS